MSTSSKSSHANVKSSLNFKEKASILINNASTLEERMKVVSEIRDRMEITNSSEYGNFVQTMLPAFKKLLMEIVPAQFQENKENKIRSVILDILNRLS